MTFVTIRKIIGGLLLLTSAATASAQDLIARQAPVDRHLKSSDTIMLNRLIQKENLEEPANNLYSSWNNNTTHCYSRSEVPDSFRIDLRGFFMPTPSRKITSRFGYRPAFRRKHKGLDIKVYTGDTIYAAFNGRVRIVRYEASGYGNYIVIRHPNGLETIYAHLSKQLVRANQNVKAGEPIGLGGNTGLSFGSHLHFETRLLGEAIDPSLLFDFLQQDVTGDYYVFHKNASDDSFTHTASKKAEPAMSGRFYQVKAGETLYSIARDMGITVDALCSFNSNLTKKTRLRPGQILKY